MRHSLSVSIDTHLSDIVGTPSASCASLPRQSDRQQEVSGLSDGSMDMDLTNLADHVVPCSPSPPVSPRPDSVCLFTPSPELKPQRLLLTGGEEPTPRTPAARAAHTPRPVQPTRRVVSKLHAKETLALENSLPIGQKPIRKTPLRQKAVRKSSHSGTIQSVNTTTVAVQSSHTPITSVQAALTPTVSIQAARIHKARTSTAPIHPAHTPTAPVPAHPAMTDPSTRKPPLSDMDVNVLSPRAEKPSKPVRFSYASFSSSQVTEQLSQCSSRSSHLSSSGKRLPIPV